MTIDQLGAIYKRVKDDERSYIEYLSNPSYNKQRLLESFELINTVAATYYLYAVKDDDSAKQSFYRAATVKLHLHEQYEDGSYTANHLFSNHRGMCYAVLSNSNDIIERFTFFYDQFFTSLSASFIKATRAVLMNDTKELQKQILHLATFEDNKGWEKNFAGMSTAFTGLLKNDKVLVEEGIKRLLTLHEKQQQPAVVKDFFNLEGATLTKLSWLKGIQVSFNSALIPEGLMVNQELSSYHTYDFI